MTSGLRAKWARSHTTVGKFVFITTATGSGMRVHSHSTLTCHSTFTPFSRSQNWATSASSWTHRQTGGVKR